MAIDEYEWTICLDLYDDPQLARRKKTGVPSEWKAMADVRLFSLGEIDQLVSLLNAQGLPDVESLLNGP